MNGQIQYGAGSPMTSAATHPPVPQRHPESTALPDLARRLSRFRHELHVAGPHPSHHDIDRLVTLARELELRDEDIREELFQIDIARRAITLADQIGTRGLPEVTPLAPLPADERCHFVAAVRFGRRRTDQIGHLTLTTGRVRFSGRSDITVAWSEVTAAERCGHDIVVSLAESRRLLRFGCTTADEAARGAVIARHLVARVPV